MDDNQFLFIINIHKSKWVIFIGFGNWGSNKYIGYLTNDNTTDLILSAAVIVE